MTKKNKKVIVIVQARMDSNRLPGKVLMKIAGKPMLWHIINRLKYSRLVDKIIVATSVSRENDIIEEFCKKESLNFYRGREKDVLDRYYQTAKDFNAKIIVRITGDCPLIDPKIVDKVVSIYLKNMNNFDGASNVIKHTYPRGLAVEVISFSALAKSWQRARKNYQREHVVLYLYKHPDLFKLHSVENNKDLSHLRWTVDQEADLKFVREIYKRLYREEKVFLMKDILKVLEKEPNLKEINKDVKQKAIIK